LSSSALETSAPRPAGRVLLWWLPTVAWLGVLACFSTDVFSAEHTGTVLRKIIQLVYGDISHAAFEQIHFLVRKSAHFFSYGLLSAFAFFSWRATLPDARAWAARWCWLALLVTLLAGSADEFHQSFVPSRTSTWHDVLIDMSGAVFFQLVIAAWMIGRRSSREA